MDIKQRVMEDQPNSWLHKIAGIVPGFKGYMDRERRRDADKLLRTHLAREYSAQRDRLNRVQQSLLRARRMDAIAEVDRLGGLLQRFIDRVNTATYGYSGLFDPVKVEAEDLDQLYAFDMALASGVQQVSSAIDSLEDVEGEEMDTALRRLSSLLDDLNARLNQRSELLTSGKRLPSEEFDTLLDDLEPLPPYEPGGAAGTGSSTAGSSQGSGQTGTGYQPGMGMAVGGGLGPSEGAPLSGSMGGESARVAGGAGDEAGVPTTDLSMSTTLSAEPGMAGLTESNQSLSEMPTGGGMGSAGAGGPVPAGDTAGGAIESASSPGAAPGAPGHDIVDGLDMERNLEEATGVDGEDVRGA